MGTWHDVFPFFTLGLGITYSLPYYKTIDDGRKVFDGVLAVDYRCKLQRKRGGYNLQYDESVR